MGSSSSRLGSRSSRPRLNRRLSSLICGGSTSRAQPEIEDCPAELLVNAIEHNDPVTVEQSSTKASHLASSAGTAFTSTRTETGTSSESSSAAREDTSFINDLSNIETSNRGKCLSESKELIPPHLVSDEPSQVDPYWERSSNIASASFKDLHPLDPVSANARANMGAVNVHNSMDKDRSNSGAGVIHSSSSHAPEHRASYSDGASAENHVSGVSAIDNSSSVSVPAVTDSPVTLHSQGDESIQEAIPSGLGIVVSDRADRERGRRDGSVLHVDVVSISSNILSSTTAEVSNREARRNSRRLFWDAFSRRSSRRHSDSPTIVFSTDDTDDLGSHDRWLLDFSGDFFEDGVGGDSGYLGSRIHSMNERRWHSRSEIWERLRGGLDESSRRTTTCPTGLHPDGMCSCDSFLMAEESSTRASISRIVMLAEALFEVLDEIHRQPVSLALSMVSLPAPESVVDSFPLKNHKKADTAQSGEDVAQCYICLAEYEEGDKIRVLPCHHEYHMSCVDKWLKEIHGVCPLCRGDVREGLTGGSVSNGETPSL
ncbi:uncharacterized protein LOC100263653 isoform X2 [Vitis vinifera]|nr:uncharacterized protein LOC100263653 isoform X2 [Vitis vinifera]|eukprot:XP_002266433.1 PREDICTED: E3 ubiquitin-protein ligase RLIM [Vitis vinifera]